MTVARSTRIARLLLVAAGALVAGVAVYIAALSQDPSAASPWLILLLLNAGAFIAAAVLLARDPHRARILAVGAALAICALGTITGFGAGMLSFPAAALGVLGAWATLLAPPRRPWVIAFAAYLAIGLVLTLTQGGQALLFPLTWTFVVVWPIRLLLFPGASVLGIHAILGLALSVALLAFVATRRPRAAVLTVGGWMIIAAAALLTGVAALALFNAYAVMRTNTSARYDLLDPLVLVLVFAGGLLAAAGAIAMRLRPGTFSAFSLGIGAALLFMTFTARPAITCERNGVGQGTPLAWSIRTAIEGGPTEMRSSGGDGTVLGASPSTTTGQLCYGHRIATFRCDGDQLVEYRELPRGTR